MLTEMKPHIETPHDDRNSEYTEPKRDNRFKLLGHVVFWLSLISIIFVKCTGGAE